MSAASQSNQGDGKGRARFSINDPKWARRRKGQKRGTKIRLDSRFAGLFTNPDFAETTTVDPLGRPVKAEESISQRLRRVYELDEPEDAPQQALPEEPQGEHDLGVPESEEGVMAEEKEKEKEGQKEPSTTEGDQAKQEKNKAKKVQKKAVVSKNKKKQKKSTKPKQADSDDELVPAPQHHQAEEEEEEGEGQETHRLAICKCDWEKVRAVDLLVLLQSFVPATGAIMSVTVYPSRFGQKRLEQEAKHGPQGIFRAKKKGQGGRRTENDIDEEKLRKYELEKLDYYYAVVECDSPATAAEIYKACNGLEFERSSNVLDLSFIPDHVTFDLPPRETAREVPSNYEAPDYYTSALQHSKVELTWDADDTQRRHFMQKKAKRSVEELKMSDFKAYLASDSEESDLEDDNGGAPPQLAFELEMPASVDEAPVAKGRKKKQPSAEKIDPSKRDKYKALLGALDTAEDGDMQQDMEITFVPGLSEKVQSLLDAKDNPDALKRKRKREARASRQDSFGGGEDGYDDDKDDEGRNWFEGGGDLISDGEEDEGDEDEEDGGRRKRAKGDKKKKGRGKKTEEERKHEAELSLLTLEEDLESAAHKRTTDESDRKPKKGRNAHRVKAREEAKAAADLDLRDPRFRELVTSSDFAIDPTRAKKNSETVNKILLERSRLRGQALDSSEAPPASAGSAKGAFKDSSLNSLVSSLKAKGLGGSASRRGGRVDKRAK